jgi:hypothetical protein
MPDAAYMLLFYLIIFWPWVLGIVGLLTISCLRTRLSLIVGLVVSVLAIPLAWLRLNTIGDCGWACDEAAGVARDVLTATVVLFLVWGLAVLKRWDNLTTPHFDN